jgi:hypothetical protein
VTLVFATCLVLISGDTYCSPRTIKNCIPETQKAAAESQQTEINAEQQSQKTQSEENAGGHANFSRRVDLDLEDNHFDDLRGILNHTREEKHRRLRSMQKHQIIFGGVFVPPLNT